MSPNNYKQLLIRGIILGSIIFFSNHLTSHAQDLPEKTDKILNIVLPSTILSGQEQGRQQEFRSSVIQGEIIQQQNQEEENGIEILEQQEDKVQEVQEELEEEDDTNIASITTSNIIKEEEEEESNSDIPLELPFP
jgi:anion-transporting  ArsA/GET3 family ATPase